MPLILKPIIDDLTRDELEAFVEQCRAKRLSAAVEYHTGVLAKLEHESDKVQRQMKQQITMLHKEFARFDKAYDAMVKRLHSIEMYEQELGLIGDQMGVHK